MFDSITVSEILLVAVVGGLIGLDRTALGQFMISQPVVAGPLTGWILGDPAAGLIIGGALELIWVLDMPIGTFVPADSTVAAVAATAVAVLGGDAAAPLPGIGFSLLLSVAVAPVTMAADHILREQNARLPGLAMSPRGDATERRIAAAHLAGVGAFFLKSFVLYVILVPAGLGAMHLFHRMPGPAHRAMALFVTLLPFLGVASVARKLSLRTLDRLLIGGAVIGAAAAQLLHLPYVAVLILAAAAGWQVARYHGT